MALVLGAAFGPSATQVEVRDVDSGALVATGAALHRDHGPDVDDPTTWWRSLASAISQTGEREIAAISVCGSHPGLVLLDGAGAVLRPMQPWADTPPPVTTVSRLAWLRRSDPNTFARIGAALLPHDWLTYRLTGRVVTDRGGASLSGAWSPATEGWLTRVLAELAPDGSFDWWRGRLPDVLGPSERADWLDAPVYDLLALRGRPLVGPGTGEPMAVALALGLTPGRAAISVGATTTVLAGLARPITDPTGVVRSHADATGRHLAIAGAGEGAGLIEAVGSLLDVSFQELSSLAHTPGADAVETDLVLVPATSGREGAVLTGLSAGVSRSDLARAAFNGVACAALDVVDLVLTAGGTWDEDEPLRLSAPAPHVEALARVLADLADRPVHSASGESMAAAGACIQAAAVLEERAPDDLAAEWDLGDDDWVEPDDDPTREARRAAYTEEHARQRRALRNV